MPNPISDVDKIATSLFHFSSVKCPPRGSEVLYLRCLEKIVKGASEILDVGNSNDSGNACTMIHLLSFMSSIGRGGGNPSIKTKAGSLPRPKG